MRKPGLRDAWLALKLYELRQDGGLAQARDVLSGLVSQSFDEIRTELDYAQPKHACLRQAVEYWEMAAAFVLRSLFHPDVYLDTCDEALFTYAVFQEHLPRIREVRPNFFAKTEAVIQEHPAVKGRLMEVRTRIFRARAERSDA
jgi:hypothetical protein